MGTSQLALLVAAALFTSLGHTVLPEEKQGASATTDTQETMKTLLAVEGREATATAQASRTTSTKGNANFWKKNIKATTLRCYTCYQESSHDKCQTISNCSISNTFCQTTVATSSAGPTISKNCAPICVPSNNEINGIAISISCCNTDLCNTNRASPLKDRSFLSLWIAACFVIVSFISAL